MKIQNFLHHPDRCLRRRWTRNSSTRWHSKRLPKAGETWRLPKASRLTKAGETQSRSQEFSRLDKRLDTSCLLIFVKLRPKKKVARLVVQATRGDPPRKSELSRLVDSNEVIPRAALARVP